jgi:hypothetical protein
MQMHASRTGGTPLPPPAVAIIVLANAEVGGSQTEIGNLARQEPLELARATVARTVLALTGVLDGPWSIERSWFDFVDPDLHEVQSGVTWAESSRDAPDPFGATDLTDEHAAFATRYLALTGAIARKLDIASTRLNLARRRRWPGEKSLDASFALGCSDDLAI